MLAALLPAATLVLTGYGLRPDQAAVAPRRLAAVRATVAVGAYAVLGIEVLSAFHAITVGSIVGMWLLALAGSAGLALLRRRRDRAAGRGIDIRAAALGRWRAASPVERALGVALAVLVLAELVLSLVSPPNNYDSYHYHLPKIEHWVAQHDVGLYPTFAKNQVANPPGAEYLLLHLRLLTGGDRLYNLAQWAAALGCALVASRIAAQLGIGRLAQLLAAATVAGAPMVVLEATSTQNDLVVVAWLTCAATLVVDELGRRSGATAVLLIGTAAGLTAVTKPTGWVALGPVLLLWGLAQLRQRAVVRTAAATVGILALIGILVGPHLLRLNTEFGSPLGPPEQSANLTMQRHDPPSVLINSLRIGASTLLVPLPSANKAVADAVIGFAHAIGVDPEDWRTTLATYPSLRPGADEDRSPYPVQSALVLLATFGVLVARRVPGRVRAYALTVLGVLVAYGSILKWQPWGNRLVGGALILGAPLVGWALSRLVARASGSGARGWRDRLRPPLVAAVAVVVAGGLAHGYYAVARGAPRPLVGHGSVVVRDEWDVRFARLPDHLAYYRWGADEARGVGAHRVGFVLIGDQWEYPWWKMLPGVELVSLTSILPHHPAPPSTSVDAILCAAPADVCRAYVPPGWRFEVRGGWYGFASPSTSAAKPDQVSRPGQ